MIDEQDDEAEDTPRWVFPKEAEVPIAWGPFPAAGRVEISDDERRLRHRHAQAARQPGEGVKSWRARLESMNEGDA